MTPASEADLPSFRNPPLDEVAAGVQFTPTGLLLADIGAFHTRIKQDYPTALDAPPLPPSFETFGPAPLQLGGLGLLSIPGSPWRSWFVSSDDEHLVQLQKDRLLVNWRMRSGQRPYPRYPQLRRRFVAAARELVAFVSERGLPQLVPNQYELSYFNMIPIPPEGTFADIGQVIVGADLARRDRPGRQFTEIMFRAGRILTVEDGTPYGGLTVDCVPGVDLRGTKVWRLTITVRGRPVEAKIESVLESLDRAHIEIVTCFADLTTERMQEAWGRVS
jgi:uncharacterized protein (TIGR04255 family)